MGWTVGDTPTVSMDTRTTRPGHTSGTSVVQVDTDGRTNTAATRGHVTTHWRPVGVTDLSTKPTCRGVSTSRGSFLFPEGNWDCRNTDGFITLFSQETQSFPSVPTKGDLIYPLVYTEGTASARTSWALEDWNQGTSVASDLLKSLSTYGRTIRQRWN